MFDDMRSITADGLCIGWLGQWEDRGQENSNMQEFFCMTLYISDTALIYLHIPLGITLIKFVP